MVRKIALFGGISIWLAMVCVGMGWLWSYNQTAGAAGSPPMRWPADAKISPDSSKFTLLVLAHPQCPCTRATVEELSQLMTHTQGRINAYVLFVTPSGYQKDWYRTDLWSNAAIIPGVRTVVDNDGVEARRFSGFTSGQVMVYSPQGELKFHGGITQSRGHVGDNAGRSAIEALVNSGKAESDHTVVFGCPLFNPESECRVPNHGNDPQSK